MTRPESVVAARLGRERGTPDPFRRVSAIRGESAVTAVQVGGRGNGPAEEHDEGIRQVGQEAEERNRGQPGKGRSLWEAEEPIGDGCRERDERVVEFAGDAAAGASGWGFFRAMISAVVE